MVAQEAAPPAKSLPTIPFQEVASQYQLNYQHQDLDFIDFNFQRTLPHKFSQYGPSIAIGDANGDGRDDIFLGGSRGFDQTWMWQQADGQFQKESVSFKTDGEKREEDIKTVMKDAYVIHFVGEKSIKLAVKNKWIDENRVITIKRIPHAEALILRE